MTRPLRKEYPGSWHYIKQPVSTNRTVFYFQQYRQIYLQLLEDMVLQFGIEVHAYALPDECSHILLRNPQVNLAKAMSWLSSMFTRKVNQASDASGHIFNGRYRSVLFDHNQYLADLSRYIHLAYSKNYEPIKRNQEEPFRSSASYYAGRSKVPVWLSTDRVRSSISRSDRTSYDQFLKQGNSQEILQFFARERIKPILGDRRFRAMLDKELSVISSFVVSPSQSKTTEEMIQILGELLEVSEDYLKRKPRPRKNDRDNALLKEYRQIAVFLCRVIGGLSAKETADLLALGHHSSVSKIISGVNNKIRHDVDFASKIESLIQIYNN